MMVLGATGGAASAGGAGTEGGAGTDDLDRKWRVLTELVRDAAEGFAATDPADAVRFRSDADRFCGMDAPRDEEDALARCGDASDLREAWAALFVNRMDRPPQ